MVIVGGGATGAGIAVDAASRGYEVLLLEQSDFGKGTSSRSTKLVHGGVRYLEQGNISLVMEALKERGILRQNAPHIVHNLAFVVPNYDWWEAPFYGLGLKVYNLLSGKYGFGTSEILSREETLARLPTIKTEGLARRSCLLRRSVRRHSIADQPDGDGCGAGRRAVELCPGERVLERRRWISEWRVGGGSGIGRSLRGAGEGGDQCDRRVRRCGSADGRTRCGCDDRAQPGNSSGAGSIVSCRATTPSWFRIPATAA